MRPDPRAQFGDTVSRVRAPRFRMRRLRPLLTAAAILVVMLVPAPYAASAYGWPVKPFHKPHPIRGTFGDPRFHLDAEGQLSAFHFGVDIPVRDGTPVYAVEP